MLRNEEHLSVDLLLGVVRVDGGLGSVVVLEHHEADVRPFTLNFNGLNFSELLEEIS